MQSLLKLTIFSLIAIGTLSACSGGGSSLPAGQQCHRDFNPIPMDVAPGTRKSLKPEDKAMTGNSSYVYQGAHLYYVAPGGPNSFRIEVLETKQNDGTFKASVGCVRNAKENMKDIAITAPGATQIDIDSAFGSTVWVSNFGFNVTNTKITATAVAAQQNSKVSPADIFPSPEKVKGAESFMIQNSDTSWEVRSSAPTEDGGVYYLSISYTRGPLPVVVTP